MIDVPPTKIMIARVIWKLRETNKVQFKQRLLSYLNAGYPGWHPLRLEDPFVICEDRRNKQAGS